MSRRSVKGMISLGFIVTGLILFANSIIEIIENNKKGGSQ